MQNRRNEKTMLNLILKIAKDDKRIRAVILNGSRTSPSAKTDIFQDYDIVYLVTDVESFVNDADWIKKFGEILILQKPDEMDGIWPRSKDKYAYLMQFKDWNRIDLTLLHLNTLPTMPRDSQSILLLDKDSLIGKFDAPSDNDYFPKPPTKKEFYNCCNEFLWVSTYVAKGIWRKELTYAKYVSEQIVKEELIKLLTWHAGLKTGYQKIIGKFGKYLEKYIEPEIWSKFTETYVDANYQNMWKSLFLMCEIFNVIASEIASHYGYEYNQKEYNEVVEYLTAVKNES
jgi:aminoglycoside 6-adenylyltransferase